MIKCLSFKKWVRLQIEYNRQFIIYVPLPFFPHRLGWSGPDPIGVSISLCDFGDLGLLFKVTGGQRMLENALSALCLLQGWMDFN